MQEQRNQREHPREDSWRARTVPKSANWIPLFAAALRRVTCEHDRRSEQAETSERATLSSTQQLSGAALIWTYQITLRARLQTSLCPAFLAKIASDVGARDRLSLNTRK